MLSTDQEMTFNVMRAKMKPNRYLQILLVVLITLVRNSWTFSTIGRYNKFASLRFQRGERSLCMVLDDYVGQKLENIKRTFEALTERLADPDVVNDQKQVLSISKERSSIEETVQTYEEWKNLETEKLSLIEMEKNSDELDLKEMIKSEIKEIISKQEEIEKKITLLLLPKDPNDDRNVMLEIRAGTGGDEASIFAGDLVNIYRKYAESLGWKVTEVSKTAGEAGGYKTCVLQITGNFVYSKLKYEVRRTSSESKYD